SSCSRRCSSGARSTACGSRAASPPSRTAPSAPSRGASSAPLEFFRDLVRGAYSLDSLVQWGGYGVLFAIVFAETGLLVGFFLPIVRTFAPVLAGVGGMEYRRFIFYNVAGGVGWVVSMTWVGYLLRQSIPNIGSYIHIVVPIVIVLSCIPIAVELLRERRRRPG